MNPNMPVETTTPRTPARTSGTPLERELPERLSEETYLAAEVGRRREELANAVGAALDRLRDAKNLRRWVRRYPWPTVGAAAAAGFTAATVVTSAKGEKLSEKLNRFASHANHHRQRSAALAASPGALAGVPFALASIVHAVLDLAKLLIERTADRPAAAGTNGAAVHSAVPPRHERE
jgi:hypothetical protein